MATLEENLQALRAERNGEPIPQPVEKEEQKQPQQSETGRLLAEFNTGLTNVLGFPVDAAAGILKLTGLVDNSFDPVGSSKSMREGLSSLGVQFPEEGSRPDDFAGRAARIGGETILPAGGLQAAGSKLSTKAFDGLSTMQKALVGAARKPKTTAATEVGAVLGASAGGTIAADLYPEDYNVELLGELVGGMTPSTAIEITKRLTDFSLLGKNVKATFSGQGDKLRAGRTLDKRAQDSEGAFQNLLDESILDLDPVTRSDDVGIASILKAATNKDPEFAKAIDDATRNSINKAKKLTLGGGNPDAPIEYLQGLRNNAAIKSQESLLKLSPNASPVETSRVIRQSVENALGEARRTESQLWRKLPTEGRANVDNVASRLNEELLQRSVAADPNDIPNYVKNLIGNVDNKGNFKTGVAIKNPNLKTLKDLRSRLGADLAAEQSKDAPNRNKIRILRGLREELHTSLAQTSPEYGEAVNFSRQLNQKFSQGRIGKLLGFERSGGAAVTEEGTASFLLGSSAENVRKGLDQLKQASPEALPAVEEYMKGLFGSVAIRDGSRTFDPERARRFLKQHETVLAEFPNLVSGIRRSIDNQKLVDEMFGANKGSILSKQIKDKAVTSLYLEGDADQAMQRLLRAKNSEGQGAVMQQMIDLVNKDTSGEALEGLKTAYGQYLIRHSEPTQDFDMLSGTKYSRLLRDTREAAKRLYTKDELNRLDTIGRELMKIERREGAKAAPGVITDAPGRIISFVGGTAAARAGAAAGAGTSGASLRTASLATRQFNEVLGKLTRDGAEQVLTGAMKDPEKLRVLLMDATPDNLSKFNKLYGNYIPATALAGGQAATSVSEGKNPTANELSLEENLQILRQNQSNVRR